MMTATGSGGKVTDTVTVSVIDPSPTLSLVVTPPEPSISPDTPLGTSLAMLQGTWSDGSPFTGYFEFVAPNYDCNSIYAISGNTLIVNPNGPGVGTAGGSIHDVTIMAIE
jgi:hypothetical protein